VAGSSPAIWAGLDPAPKILEKIISKKAVIFRKYFYCILINIGLYFYTIKYKFGIKILGFRKKIKK
jgi:hypothetical protein